MKPLDYYLLNESRSYQPDDSIPLDELIEKSYSGVEQPLDDRASVLMSRPDLTSKTVPLSLPARMPTFGFKPRTISYEIPSDVRKRAKLAAAFAQADNFFGGLGQSGRSFRPNVMAPVVAESAVLNDYINRRKAEEEMRLNRDAAEMAKQKFEMSMQPKQVDQIAQAKSIAELRKAEADATLKERSLSDAEKELSNKRELVDIINTAMKKPVATEAMSLKTLEDMAADIGLDPLKYRRAVAVGGGKGSEFSTTANPEVSTALLNQLNDISKWLPESQKQAANALMSSPNVPNKTKAEYMEKYNKYALDWEKEARKSAERTIDTIYDKERNTVEIFTKLNELQDFMRRNKNKFTWDRVVSTLRQFPYGSNALKAVNSDPKTIEFLTRIDGVEQAYARAKSGAAIGAREWQKFKDEIGSGVFADANQLYKGTSVMIGSIKNTVKNMWNIGVDPRIRYDDVYLDRLKVFDIRKPSQTPQEAWNRN